MNGRILAAVLSWLARLIALAASNGSPTPTPAPTVLFGVDEWSVSSWASTRRLMRTSVA